ncbi:MAG: hypothetical protein ACFE95_05135 [Candidatus Hodarchaeota archaeon]
MIEHPFLFFIFILIVFSLLTLLALTIDLLNRFLFRKELENIHLPLPIRAQIDDIVIQINSHEFSEKKIEHLIALCPVGAIASINEPESLLEISDKKCLGYSCLKCLEEIESEFQ